MCITFQKIVLVFGHINSDRKSLFSLINFPESL
jgi:hypothetical protein